jgi:hypothetical protein
MDLDDALVLARRLLREAVLVPAAGLPDAAAGNPPAMTEPERDPAPRGETGTEPRLEAEPDPDDAGRRAGPEPGRPPADDRGRGTPEPPD